jgi:short-subunit dehydrogenase
VNVFITGASSGLGEALVRHYAQRGATVGVFARRADALERVANDARGGTVAVYAGDVRDATALQSAGAHFIQAHGVPDLVVANAGVSRGTLTEHAEDLPAFRAVIETNLLGMVHTFHPFVDAMRTRGTGTLAGVASVAGFRGIPGSGAYSASKAAAIIYLESLRVELVGSGVRVVTICPGYVATPLTARNPYRMPFILQPDDAAARIARAIASGRRFAVIPWPMAIVGRVLRALPRPLYDRAFRNAPRKPRMRDGGEGRS